MADNNVKQIHFSVRRGWGVFISCIDLYFTIPSIREVFSNLSNASSNYSAFCLNKYLCKENQVREEAIRKVFNPICCCGEF